MVTHPSTNWAQRTVTLLRQQTMLPLFKNADKTSTNRQHCDIPRVTVPQQHADAIDNGRLSKSYDNAMDVVVVNRMSCKAAVEVVIDRITVKQCCFHLTSDHLSTVPQARDVLVQICSSQTNVK